MEVILLERIPRLGNLGEKIQVKAGFGRNYLIPNGKALAATRNNLVLFEAKRVALQTEAAARLAEAKAKATALEGLVLHLVMHAGEEGKLFGSVTALDIVNALLALGHRLDKQAVRFLEGPIRQLGDYEVALLLLGDDVIARLKVSVRRT